MQASEQSTLSSSKTNPVEQTDGDAEKEAVSPQKSKPFAWPFALILFVAIVLGASTAFAWYLQDYVLLLRIIWVSLCSFVPGLLLMTVLGSISHLRHRPFLSSLSLFLGIIGIAVSFWAVQKILSIAPDFLK